MAAGACAACSLAMASMNLYNANTKQEVHMCDSCGIAAILRRTHNRTPKP